MKKREVVTTVKSIKRGSKIGKILFWTGWGLWFLNTIIFLFIDGWHIGASEGSIENKIDHLAGGIMIVALFWLVMENTRMTSFMLKLLEEDLKSQ